MKSISILKLVNIENADFGRKLLSYIHFKSTENALTFHENIISDHSMVSILLVEPSYLHFDEENEQLLSSKNVCY